MGVSLDDIKTLRQQTGAGMAKCRSALEEANGDVEQAVIVLRKAGAASAEKKAGRETKEGMIAVAENAQKVVLVEVNAETDFVVRNEKFGEFACNIAEEALQLQGDGDLDALMKKPCSKDSAMTVEEYRALTVQHLGENIQCSRVCLLPKKANATLSFYNHMKGKAIAVVEIEGSEQQQAICKELGMQVVATLPDYLDCADVPESIREREREIAREQIRDKPPQIQEKILEGKLKAFYQTTCLLQQQHIKESAQTVEQWLKAESQGKSLRLSRYVLWKVGGLTLPQF